MLFNFTKKLCPLMSLVVALGCGKKIGEADSSDNSRSIQSQTPDLPSSLNIQVNEQQAAVKSFKVPRNAWLKGLPESLSVLTGNSAGKRVKIYYNYWESQHAPYDYEFHCFYKATVNMDKLTFERCERPNGSLYISQSGNNPATIHPLDKGSFIKMELTNPSTTPSPSNIIVEANYVVIWK